MGDDTKEQESSGARRQCDRCLRNCAVCGVVKDDMMRVIKTHVGRLFLESCFSVPSASPFDFDLLMNCLNEILHNKLTSAAVSAFSAWIRTLQSTDSTSNVDEEIRRCIYASARIS